MIKVSRIHLLLLGLVSAADGTTRSLADYSVEVTGGFPLPYASQVRGMDFDEPSSLLLVSGGDHRFYWCSASDGSVQGAWDLSPENGEPYGLANWFGAISVNDHLKLEGGS